MLKVVPNSSEIYCYDANGQRLFIYRFNNGDESWYMASLKQFSQEQIENEMLKSSERHAIMSAILDDLDSRLDAKEITVEQFDEIWVEENKKRPVIMWEDMVEKLFGMKALALEQDCRI